jgi:RimJ/RimL family protein N-acetyltransferase
MTKIPTLETDRLILRTPLLEDLEPMTDFFQNSVRAKFVGGPMDKGEVWRALLRAAGHWQIRGYGFWHIIDRATGLMCGYTGYLHHIEWPEAELAWGVFDGYEGKGIAFEAVQAASEAGPKLGLHAPVSLINPKNIRSRSLAERLGAWVEEEKIFMEEPVVIYRHPTKSG